MRPGLFALTRNDPEAAHRWAVGALAALAAAPALASAASWPWRVADRPRQVFGLRFPNPVGLAAGFDKDARAAPALAALGFGFIEVGTVTRYGQPGKPRPRVFRLPRTEALINRMGFNNRGAHAMARTLRGFGLPQRRLAAPLGVSLGKTAVTPLAEALDDYRASLDLLHPYADFFVVNVSSPNTQGLRRLQGRAELATLLGGLRQRLLERAGAGSAKPLLLKIAPDLTEAAVAEVLHVCDAAGVSGVIAANTTLARVGVAASETAIAAQSGGLSGAPLTAVAHRMVKFIHRETAGRLPVIGVGGILTPDAALRLLDAGASLVQLYTGLVYRGPGLLYATQRAVARRAG